MSYTRVGAFNSFGVSLLDNMFKHMRSGGMVLPLAPPVPQISIDRCREIPASIVVFIPRCS